MKKKIVSDFTQISFAYPLDHKDFKFWMSSKKKKKVIFFLNFYLTLEDPQKFLKSIFSNFLKKMPKVALLDIGKY